MLNSRPAIVVYAESPSRPAAIAVPKYRPDCAAAAPRVLAAALAAGITIITPAAATAETAPAISNRTRNDRLPVEPGEGCGELIATMASIRSYQTDERRTSMSDMLARQPRRNNSFRKSPGTYRRQDSSLAAVMCPQERARS